MTDTKLNAFMSPSQFREYAHVNRLWRCNPEVATSFEDLFRPEYWAHVAATVLAGDRIEALAEDMSYFAELLVVDASRNWVKVKLLRKVELTEEEAEPLVVDEEYEVKWRGNRRWSVVRRVDGAVLQENLASKAEGYAWLADHQKKVA